MSYNSDFRPSERQKGSRTVRPFSIAKQDCVTNARQGTPYTRGEFRLANDTFMVIVVPSMVPLMTLGPFSGATRFLRGTSVPHVQ